MSLSSEPLLFCLLLLLPPSGISIRVRPRCASSRITGGRLCLASSPACSSTSTWAAWRLTCPAPSAAAAHTQRPWQVRCAVRRVACAFGDAGVEWSQRVVCSSNPLMSGVWRPGTTGCISSGSSSVYSSEAHQGADQKSRWCIVQVHNARRGGTARVMPAARAAGLHLMFARCCLHT